MQAATCGGPQRDLGPKTSERPRSSSRAFRKINLFERRWRFPGRESSTKSRTSRFPGVRDRRSGISEVECVDVGDRSPIGGAERAPAAGERREVPGHRRAEVRSMGGRTGALGCRTSVGLACGFLTSRHVWIPEEIEGPDGPLFETSVGLESASSPFSEIPPLRISMTGVRRSSAS